MTWSTSKLTEWPPPPLRGGSSDGIVSCHKLAEEALGDHVNHPDSGARAFAYLWRRFGPPTSQGDPDKGLCTYLLTTPDPDVWLILRPSFGVVAYKVSYLAREALHEEHERPRTEWWLAYRQWAIAHVCEQEGLDASADYPQAVVERVRAKVDAVTLGESIPKAALADLGDPPWLRRGEGPVAERVVAALRAALTDLLRPVFVRDVPASVLGRDQSLFVGDEAPRFDLHKEAP